MLFRTLALLVFGCAAATAPARADPCDWPCAAYITVSSDSTPPTYVCDRSASRSITSGADFATARYDIGAAELVATGHADSAALGATVEVFESIRAHGRSGGPVQLRIELEVTLERDEPATG